MKEMEFSEIQEKLSERCSNCFCEMAPSKNYIPLKVGQEEIRAQSTEVEDNFVWSTENSEFNVFEAVTFIHRWTTEEFTESLLTVLKLEYSQATESFPFLLSVCATCKPILLQLFRLSQEFNQLSNKYSIITRIRDFLQSKYESILHVKAEPYDNSDANGSGHDSFLFNGQNLTNLSNGNDYESDYNVEFHNPVDLPAWRQRTRAQKSKVARPVKSREVNMRKKNARANTVCNDVSVSIPRLAESIVKASTGSSLKFNTDSGTSVRILRREMKKEIPEDESKYFESETSDTDVDCDIRMRRIHITTTHTTTKVSNRRNYKKKKFSKNKLLQKYKCDRCDREFPTKKLVDIHKKSHTKQDRKTIPKLDPGPGPFQCPYCPKLVSNYDDFRYRHLKAHEKDLSVICDVCGKRIINKRKLLLHKRLMHPEEGSTPEKPCPLCGKCVRHLSFHMKLHDTDRENFTCEQCEKTFKSKFAWRDHAAWAHSGEKFICATCGKEFQTKWLLSNHKRIHSKERPYPCETCEKTFRNRSEVESHKATHSDARPFLCNLCGKDFKNRNNFRTHMQGHKSKDLGTAVFSCSQCGQTFKNGTTRARHIKNIHEGQSKRHSCPVCFKMFRDSYNLNAHRRRAHKEDSDPIF